MIPEKDHCVREGNQVTHIGYNRLYYKENWNGLPNNTFQQKKITLAVVGVTIVTQVLGVFGRACVNPLMGTLKPQSNGPLYDNTAIGTLAVDEWAVTFGTARKGLGGLQLHIIRCNTIIGCVL